MYLLDTNHCSFIIIQKDPSVLKHLSELDKNSRFAINAVIYSELVLLAEKSEQKVKNRALIENFIKITQIYEIISCPGDCPL